MNNECDLFCVTSPDVIGAAPFSVCSVPLTAFLSTPHRAPQSCPSQSFVYFWSAFVPGDRPSFPLEGLFI